MKKRLLLICGILILVAVIALEATNAMNKGSTNTEEVISKPNKMAEPAQSTAESALPEPVLQGRKVNMDDAMWVWRGAVLCAARTRTRPFDILPKS